MGVATILTKQPGGALASIHRLRALVLLAGSVRPTRLAAGIGRPLFELPLESNCTILDAWRREAAELAQHFGLPQINVRVLIDRGTPDPTSQPAAARDLAPARIERDPVDYRGTGGVLHDLAEEYADNDLLVVANAAQILLEPLKDLVSDLAATCGDVSIVSHDDGTASGLLLVRCGAVRELSENGFIDLKEQALPAIAESHRVSVVHRPTASAMPVRMLPGYIEAMRRYHQRKAGRAVASSAFEESWESSFDIVESGAEVDPSVRLHDSVVLAGGRAEAGAVLVHSVLCRGAVLRAGAMKIDDVLAPGRNGRPRD